MTKTLYEGLRVGPRGIERWVGTLDDPPVRYVTTADGRVIDLDDVTPPRAVSGVTPPPTRAGER